MNDHADVDGFLALYALLESETALANYDTLVGAAAMGDFLAWADRPAFRLAQELSLLLSDPDARPADVGDVLRGGDEDRHRRARRFPPGSAGDHRGLGDHRARLRADRARRRAGRVDHRSPGFVRVSESDLKLDAALKIPILNAVVDDSVWLWPQVRNREHGQRVQIVSVPVRDGWFHDVWVPSYSWAETPDRWTPPGLVSTGDSNVWNVDHEPLRRAAAELDRLETAPGRWVSADRLTPWTTMSGRAFPVVLSFLVGDDDDRRAEQSRARTGRRGPRSGVGLID